MEEASPENGAVAVSGGVSTSASVGDAAHGVDIRKRAEALGLPPLETIPKSIEKSVLSFVPEDTARKYQMAVFSKEGDTIRIAMVDPEDFEALNMLRFLAEKERLNIEIHLTSPEIIEEIFKQYSGADRALKEAISSLKKDEPTGVALEGGDAEAAASTLDQEIIQDAPIARLVEATLNDWIRTGNRAPLTSADDAISVDHIARNKAAALLPQIALKAS